MKWWLFALPVLLAGCSGVRTLPVSLSTDKLLANGYDRTTITIRGPSPAPSIRTIGDSHYVRVSRSIQTDNGWQFNLTASILPGTVHLAIEAPGFTPSLQTVTLTPQTSDSANDGTPDYLRLDDAADQAAFRRWFTFLAEVQYFNRHRPAEISDCSALLRYAYREALRNHNEAWSSEAHLPLLPAIPSILKYSYPHTPLGPSLFRSHDGFTQFADAEALQRFNCFFVSRDVRRAEPGDVLFFRRATTHTTYHSMIFVGPSQVNRDNEIYVVYHTGPDGTNAGEIKRLSVDQLLHYPDPQWQSIAANPSFLGIFRWNILKALS